MRGVHWLTLKTVQQRFVSISKAELPSGGESLSAQFCTNPRWAMEQNYQKVLC